MEEIEQKPSLKQKIRRFLVECWRVIRITQKPGMTEYKTIVKATGIGTIIIGLIGFVLTVLKQAFF